MCPMVPCLEAGHWLARANADCLAGNHERRGKARHGRVVPRVPRNGSASPPPAPISEESSAIQRIGREIGGQA